MSLKSFYNAVRPHLPKRWQVYNGVAVRDAAIADATDHLPEFKAGLKTAIHEGVRGGDRVIDIAAGRGVAAVWAARAGARAVTSYEASPEYVAIARQTADAAGVANVVDVEHALVGEAIDVWTDDLEGVPTIAPAALPACDVLQLDCEGAELSILDELEQRPRSIIVESHPEFGAETDAVEARLRRLGYDTDRLEYEPARAEKDVLVASTERGSA